jgi:hypothetical protein
MAVNVDRIIPVEYSAVMVRTASAPKDHSAMATVRAVMRHVDGWVRSLVHSALRILLIVVARAVGAGAVGQVVALMSDSLG